MIVGGQAVRLIFNGAPMTTKKKIGLKRRHQKRLPMADRTTYVFIVFCWGNDGRKKASRKNQTALTAHRKGRKANPQMKYFLQSWILSSSVTLGFVRSIVASSKESFLRQKSFEKLESLSNKRFITTESAAAAGPFNFDRREARFREVEKNCWMFYPLS